MSSLGLAGVGVGVVRAGRRGTVGTQRRAAVSLGSYGCATSRGLVAGGASLFGAKADQPRRARLAPPRATELREYLDMLCDGRDLTTTEVDEALQLLLDGADPIQAGAFLCLMRAKGETPAEIAGMAGAMRRNGVRCDCGPGVVDIVGTGGDGANTVNISTGSTALAAACGARVAKHGNRSVSSQCGSADVLEELGVNIDLSPEGVARCVNEVGVGFMFAPRYHPAMKAVVPVRKALRVRTAFNILGPMLNPAAAQYGLIGVYSPDLMMLMAESLQLLGVERALVVHSEGIDELTPMATALALEVTKDGVREVDVNPQTLGIDRCELRDLVGGTRDVNARMLRAALGGEVGAVGDALALNAGVALGVAGVAGSYTEGVAMAKEMQRSGKALATLDAWAKLSTSIS